MIDNQDEIIALWVKLGKPVIHIGDGENCFDLEILLNSEGMLPRHVDVIQKWFSENNK
jgi:hypothetical protein